MQTIKCFITGKQRQDTPEEKVRQETAKWLVDNLGYEKSRIEVEFKIRIGSSGKRLDLAVFPKDTEHTQDTIFAILECKTKKFTVKEENQLKSYLAACINCKWGLLKEYQSQKAFRRIRRDGNFTFDVFESIPDSRGQTPKIISTDRSTSKWHLFDEARKTARDLSQKLGLKNSTQWKKYCRDHCPDQIPVYPDRVYRGKGWINWNNWLGKDYLPFSDARDIARSLNLSGESEWRKYCTGKLEQEHGLKPDKVPSNPSRVYLTQGWVSWGDWLGTGIVSTQKRTFLDFGKAQKRIHALNIQTETEWRKFCKGELKEKCGTKPGNIPANPDKIYKETGWISWPNWLGTNL